MQYVVGLLILCILITLHEFGHFIAARLSGVYVEEFSLGMGPCLWSKVAKKSGTKYSVRLIPIGGYCAMKGESVELDDSGHPVQQDSDSFQSVSVWKRIAIVVAGPLVNIVLGVLLALFVVVMFGVAKPTIVNVDEAVQPFGLQSGDVVTSINGTSIGISDDLYFYDIYHANDEQKDSTVHLEVVRDGKTVQIDYPMLYKHKYGFGMSSGVDTDGNLLVLQLLEENGLEKAGIKAGDKIISINGVVGTSDYSLNDYLDEHPLQNEQAVVEYERDGKVVETTVDLVELETYDRGFAYNTKPGLSENILEDTWYLVRYQSTTILKSLGGLLTGRFSVSDLSGPVAIVDVIGDTYNSAVHTSDVVSQQASMSSLFELILMLTLNLGIFNLLPIPALDGGRLVFLLVEVVRRKRVPVQIEQKIHQVGLLVLLGLSVVIIIKDMYQLLF